LIDEDEQKKSPRSAKLTMRLIPSSLHPFIPSSGHPRSTEDHSPSGWFMPKPRPLAVVASEAITDSADEP